MKRAKCTLKIMVIFSVITFLLSCNPIENETESDSMLIIVKLTGKDLEDNEVNYLQSDVLFEDPDTGQTYVTADEAKVTFTAKLLDPLAIDSHYNSILVERYIVSYIRSDGKSTEGVDVPYSFEGSLSVLVNIDEESEASFIIVREVAKLEPPLINLHEGRGEGVLEVKAKVEFYGRDLSNRRVKATGYLTIFFANYVNE